MTTSEIIVGSVAVLSGAFILLAAIGVLRMPDLLTRLQATSKAATSGAGLMLAAAAIHFGDVGITLRAIAVAAFVFVTAPVAAHMISRAAYFTGIRLTELTVIDELVEAYDPDTHLPHARPRLPERRREFFEP